MGENVIDLIQRFRVKLAYAARLSAVIMVMGIPVHTKPIWEYQGNTCSMIPGPFRALIGIGYCRYGNIREVLNFANFEKYIII